MQKYIPTYESKTHLAKKERKKPTSTLGALLYFDRNRRNSVGNEIRFTLFRGNENVGYRVVCRPAKKKSKDVYYNLRTTEYKPILVGFGTINLFDVD